MAKQIIAYTLIGLGFLTWIFFRKYNGHVIPNPGLFWLAGLAMMGAGWWMLKSSSAQTEARVTAEVQDNIADIKAHGEKVMVDLEQCEIKRNDLSEEREVYDEYTPLSVKRDTQAWNAMTGSRQNIETVDIPQAVVIYHTTRNGKKVSYSSGILHHDRETMLFKMIGQKETTLYIDPKNPDRYYLDMEFLDA